MNFQHPARTPPNVGAFATLSDGELETVCAIQSPLLLFFWATWCGPCVLMSLVLREAAAQRPTLTVFAVDVDEAPGVTRRFEVCNVPTIVTYQDGLVTSRREGVVSRRQLLSLLQNLAR